MPLNISFYLVKSLDDTLKEVLFEVETEEPLYYSLNTGDTIILPEREEEFIIGKIIKNLATQHVHIYVAKAMDNSEIIEEMTNIASKTFESMFDSFQSDGIFNVFSSGSGKIINGVGFIKSDDASEEEGEEKP